MAKPCFYIDGKYLTNDEMIDWASKVDFSRIGKILPQYSHPETPFRKTDQWVNLALRRMMRYAAENGFDRIAWTNGEQQAERYDLSKQIDHIAYKKSMLTAASDNSPMYDIKVFDKKKYEISSGLYREDEIEGLVGKEVAQKIINGEGNAPLPGKDLPTYLTGLDLKIGGEGMKAFYDAIIPAQANKLGKPFGAKVEPIIIDINAEIDTETGDFSEAKTPKQLSIPVTPQMVETVLQGIPLFQLSPQSMLEAKTLAERQKVAQEIVSGIEQMFPGVKPASVVGSNKELAQALPMYSKQIMQYRVGGIYINGTVFINSEVSNTPERIATAWLHENVHAAITYELSSAEINKMVDDLQPSDRVLPQTYKSQNLTKYQTGHEILAHAAEKVLKTSSLQDIANGNIDLSLFPEPIKKKLEVIFNTLSDGRYRSKNNRKGQLNVRDLYTGAAQGLFKSDGTADRAGKGQSERVSDIGEGRQGDGQVIPMTKQEVSEKQNKKAEELLDALKDAGFENFGISRSITDFGVSTYVHGQLGLKFRISDHSVTSTQRIFSEIPFNYNTPISDMVKLAKETKIANDKIADQKEKAHQEYLKREKEAAEKWERIKGNFEGKVFKKNKRTYQTLEDFMKPGDNGLIRSDIYQKDLGVGRNNEPAYAYEWAEPTEYDKWGNPTNMGEKKPSMEYIEAYEEYQESIPPTITIDGVERPTTNSEGKLIHPTEQGVRDFWRWFGDSKVVDAKGRPLVVYHGTGKAKEQIEDSPIFFTPDPTIAQRYATDPELQTVEYPSIMATYLNISSPHITDLKGAEIFGKENKIIAQAKKQNADGAIIKNAVDVISEDSIEQPQTQYVVWNPSQIKSATGNSGEFSSETDNILFKLEQEKPEVRNEIMNLNTKMNKWHFKVAEGWADDILPVKAWQKMLTDNGVSIADHENFYMRHTRVSSIIEERIGYFHNSIKKPFDEISKLFLKSGSSYEDITTYMKLKHADEYTAHIQKRTFLGNTESEDVGHNYITAELKGKAKLFADKSGLDYSDVVARVNNFIFKKVENVSEEQYDEAEDKAIKAAKRMLEWNDDLAGKKAIEKRIDMDGDMFVDMFEKDHREYWENWKNNKISKIKATKGTPQYTAEVERITKIANNPTEELWRTWRDITDFALDEEVRSGFKTRKEVDEIKKIFTHYVPLKFHEQPTAEDVYEYTREHGTYFVSPVKMGKGRKSESGDPIAAAVQAAYTSVINGEKNIQLQSMYRTVRKDTTGSTSVSKTWFVVEEDASGRKTWKIADEPVFPDDYTPEEYNKIAAEYDERMEALEAEGKAKRGKPQKLNLGMFIKPANMREHEVVVWVAGVPYTIRYNTNSRLPRSINGANKVYYENAFGAVLNGVGAVTKFMARTKTTYRPIFILYTNPARDLNMGLSMAYIEYGAKFATAVAKNMGRAGIALSKHAIGKGSATNKDDSLLADYIMAGGKTGIHNIFTMRQQIKNAQKAMKRGGKMPMGKMVAGWYGAANDVTENITRLASFYAALDMGMSFDRAVLIAKDLTANFNRTGSGRNGYKEVTSFMAFTRAGVQALYTMISKSTGSKQATKRALAVVGVHAALGMALTWAAYKLLYSTIALLSGTDGDDDDEFWDAYAKLTPFERHNNFCLWTPEGFIKIPIGHETRAWHAMGSDMALAAKGKIPPSEAAITLLTGLIDLMPYNPIKEMADRRSFKLSSFVASSVDVLSPMAELDINKNFMGSPIYSEYSKDYIPGQDKIRTTKTGRTYTSKWLINLVKGIDKVTGGDGTIPGKISWNPDKVDHLLNGYLSGVYSQADWALSLMTGEQVAELVPKAMFTPMDRLYERNSDLQGQYYEISRELEKKKKYMKGYIKRIESGGISEAEGIEFIDKLDPYTWITFKGVNDSGETIEMYVDAINALEKEGKLYDSETYKKEILPQIVQVKKDLIEFYQKVTKARK